MHNIWNINSVDDGKKKFKNSYSPNSWYKFDLFWTEVFPTLDTRAEIMERYNVRYILNLMVCRSSHKKDEVRYKALIFTKIDHMTIWKALLNGRSTVHRQDSFKLKVLHTRVMSSRYFEKKFLFFNPDDACILLYHLMQCTCILISTIFYKIERFIKELNSYNCDKHVRFET